MIRTDHGWDIAACWHVNHELCFVAFVGQRFAEHETSILAVPWYDRIGDVDDPESFFAITGVVKSIRSIDKHGLEQSST